MRRENFEHLECPLARSLDMIGEWWSLLIVRDLFYGIDTFDQLCRDLGIARNMLANRMKKLMNREMVERRQDETKPRGQAYRLTRKGKDLFPVIMVLAAWGSKWECPDGPPIIFRHGSDGHAAKPAVVCGLCGEPIHAKDIQPVKGPGAGRVSALPMPLRELRIMGSGERKRHTRIKRRDP